MPDGWCIVPGMRRGDRDTPPTTRDPGNDDAEATRADRPPSDTADTAAMTCGSATTDGDASCRDAVRAFVETPLTIRRNVVKVWRPLPPGLWTALSDPTDHALARRRERTAVALVGIMVVVLAGGFASVGLAPRTSALTNNTRTTTATGIDNTPGAAVTDSASHAGAARSNPHAERNARTTSGRSVGFPLLGPARGAVPRDGTDTASFDTTPLRWYFAPGQSLPLALWTVVPPLLGWGLVRLVWIPAVLRHRAARTQAVVFARHLSVVYVFVFAMVVAGASLMPVLIIASPCGTERLRWYLWCFLFGESFFVPAVMWTRLVIHDADGAVFGRRRYAVLTGYLLLCVVVPMIGMVGQLPGTRCG